MTSKTTPPLREMCIRDSLYAPRTGHRLQLNRWGRRGSAPSTGLRPLIVNPGTEDTVNRSHHTVSGPFRTRSPFSTPASYGSETILSPSDSPSRISVLPFSVRPALTATASAFPFLSVSYTHLDVYKRQR